MAYEFDLCPSCGKKVPYNQDSIESVGVSTGSICMSCLAIEIYDLNMEGAYLTAKEHRNLVMRGVAPEWYYAELEM